MLVFHTLAIVRHEVLLYYSFCSIITEYLREQHARCKNPVTTCPPFSLFMPHQCPEPKQRCQAPTNFTSRHTRRVIYPKYGGVDGGCFDRHLIFSRYINDWSIFYIYKEDLLAVVSRNVACNVFCSATKRAYCLEIMK